MGQVRAKAAQRAIPPSAREFADISNIGESGRRIDLGQYARHHRFLALKATEGTGFEDGSFPGWWQEAGRAGVRHRIAYLYAHFHGGWGGVSDAQTFLRYCHRIGVRRKVDLPAIDLEELDAPTWQTRVELLRCCNEISRYWRAGWVYASSSFIEGLGSPELPPGWSWWIADYARGLWVPRGVGWDVIAAWQHTDGRYGKAPYDAEGIGRCDMSTLFMRGFLQARYGS